LGIVHFLGWMLGCGLVLACYRVMWHEQSPQTRLLTQTLQALFAIVYGAALGGLAMLLSHRLRGNTTFPSQPGHYLLVFAGLGCLLDGGTYALFITLQETRPAIDFDWHLRMALAWGIAAAVGIAVLIAARSPLRWRVFAAATTLVLCVNSAAYWLLWQLQRGTWTTPTSGWLLYLQQTGLSPHTEIAGSLLASATLLGAVWLDWRQCVAARLAARVGRDGSPGFGRFERGPERLVPGLLLTPSEIGIGCEDHAHFFTREREDYVVIMLCMMICVVRCVEAFVSIGSARKQGRAGGRR
jgi:hypothetical protein